MSQRIDFHAHCVPDQYRATLLDSPIAATARIPEWTFDAHLEMKERNGIALSVLSLAPPGIFHGDPTKAAEAARRCNEGLAAIKARDQERFCALAVLPLPSVDDACLEAAYALDVLKLDGVSLFSSYAGQCLGQPKFDPVLELLDARDAIAFVHPNIHPANRVVGLPWPDFVIEYPFETTRAAVNLIFSGALDRFPAIRFVLAHAGGTLPYLAYRLAMVGSQQLAQTPFVERFPLPFFTQNPEASSPDFLLSRLRRFWFEVALSAGPATLAALKEIADPNRILFGSDWPYAPETIGADTIDKLGPAASISPTERRAIEFDNARQLLSGGRSLLSRVS